MRNNGISKFIPNLNQFLLLDSIYYIYIYIHSQRIDHGICKFLIILIIYKFYIKKIYDFFIYLTEL